MDTTAPRSVVPATGRPSFLRRHRWKIILLGGLLLLAGVGALYTWAALAFTYSSGDRVGYVQKLSKKGWFCQTWEGELAMSPVPGAAPQLFAFSLRDEAIVKKIQALEGKKVALVYAQKKGVPSTCFGETEYFITDVRSAAQ